MELNRLSFVARKRTPWEVFDLTQLFVRENFTDMFKIYLFLVIPLAIVVWLLSSSSSAVFFVWWLKPVLERPLLDYLSKRSFSQPTSVWASIKSLKQLRFIDIFLTLTIFRLSPNRAYFSPVEQLEKQKGDKATKRKNLLRGRCDNKQSFWIIFCAHLELFVLCILLLISYNFIPEGITIDQQFITNNLTNENFEHIYFITYVIAISVIAPLYTTGGFLMYLNSRIQLEGWDIELTFKRIAARLSGAITILLVCTLGWLNPSPSYAQQSQEETKIEVETEEETRSVKLIEIKQDVDKIYLDNKLIEKTEVWAPVLDEKEKSDSDLSWLKSIGSFFDFLSKAGPILTVIFWAAILGFVAWVIWQIYLNSNNWFSAKAKDRSASNKEPDLPSFFTEIKHQSWPEDLLSAAEKSLQQARYREALTLILKFALHFAEQNKPGVFHQSMTEMECERAVLNVLPRRLHSQYRILFFVWMQQAWAHKSASDNQISDLIAKFRRLEVEVTP